MSFNTDYLTRCIETLEASLQRLNESASDELGYEIYRNAAVKGFELTLETVGKLLRRALRPYYSSNKKVDQLYFKDVFRAAAKHGILNPEEVERWFTYRDNRNDTAHDYGEHFAQQTLVLLPQFLQDAKQLKKSLDEAATRSTS